MRYTKTLLGAAAISAMLAATPAAAQSGRYDPYYDPYYDRDDDGFDIATGVRVVGTIAGILNAFRSGAYGNPYGQPHGQSYGYGYNRSYAASMNNAVNSCGREAQRYSGGGRVEIRDIDRVSGGRYRVQGVVDNLRGYRGYNRYDYGYNRVERDDFSCLAAGNGRVLDFDV